MTETVTDRGSERLPARAQMSPSERRRLSWCVAYVVGLTALFAWPLARLMVYAYNSNLHSHIVLVPLVAGYLLYDSRHRLPTAGGTSVPGGVASGSVGLAALIAWLQWRATLSVNDALALSALAFVSLLAAGGFLFLGRTWMRRAAFPVGFLIFTVPLPDTAVNWLETASQATSAEAAALYFRLSGVSFVRNGDVFELPGIALRVAQECSGIRSSWVLFITGLLASHLFLRNRWRRAALVAFVIPLGILRNGLRILVIGLLCVHVGPHMIDSQIHRQGGPLFFALSLVPLFLLMWWLRRGERRSAPAPRA